MSDILTLTAGIVSAHVENNRVQTAELSTLIQSVHQALAKLGEPEAEPVADKPKGAVSVRKSLASSDGIISMVDGKVYKTLKRHIAKHGYTRRATERRLGCRVITPWLRRPIQSTADR